VTVPRSTKRSPRAPDSAARREVERPDAMPDVPVRELVDLAGKRVVLALDGTR
jgi:hypothetical protein